MRCLLAALAVTALLCSSAFATTLPGITVDGDYSDWTALGLVHQDALGDNPGEGSIQGAVDINHYGATIIGGTLFAFAEITEPLTAYEYNVSRGFSGGPSMGIYINADQNYGTTLNGVDPLVGTDIMVEVHDTLNASIGVEYYGAGDNIGDAISAYHDDGTAAIMSGGYVIEWSAPVSSIISALGGLPDNVDGSYDWTVYIAGEGKIKNADDSVSLDWGYDGAGPLTIPEPGTLALLAAAGLALAMFGVRCFS